MMSLTLWKRDMVSSLKVGVILLMVMGMYIGVIIYMYDPALADMLNDYQQALPGIMSAVGMTGIATSLLEFIHIYLYGFIMLVFPMVFLIVQTNRLLVHYVDSGSLACILTTGCSRGRFVRSQLFSLVCGLILLLGAATILGIGFSEAFFPGELDMERYLLMNLCLLLVHLALGAVIFFVACLCSEARWYYMVGAGIPVLFFLFQMLSNMGGDLKVFRYLTLFSLFPADRVVAGEGGFLPQLIALTLLTAVLWGAGVTLFTKKDLPL